MQRALKLSLAHLNYGATRNQAARIVETSRKLKKQVRHGKSNFVARRDLMLRRPPTKQEKASALNAVSAYGHSLRNVHPELKADTEVVHAAVKRQGFALGYATESLRANKEVNR